MKGGIASASLEAVKERADLVELARAHTELKRAGTQWTGRCPFHDERTPSFSIQPAEKLYYCHGCGAGGDLIDFVRQTQTLTFREAVEWLADRYNIELAYDEMSADDAARRSRADRLHGLLDLAATYYQRVLDGLPAAERARTYLVERGLNADIVARYRVGYSPDAWDKVSQAAAGRGYTPEELAATGLASPGRRGAPIDRFRGRLMFPLCDRAGRVVGFGARRLPPSEDGPKYLNSPDGPVWRKGDIVYGLHIAKTAIAKGDRAIVVEGYTDVLAMAQAGLGNVVASMGTALTDRQLRELRRLSRHVTLCFDADAAGQDAAVRGMLLAEREGLEVRVATLPVGSDPADLALTDAASLERVLASARSVLAFRVERLLARAENGDAQDRDRSLAEARAVFGDAPASIERDELARQVGGRLRLPVALEADLRRVGAPKAASRRQAPSAPGRGRDATATAEELLLGFALAAMPGARERLDQLPDEAFSSELHRHARAWILRRTAGEAETEADEEIARALEPRLRDLAVREAGDGAVDEVAGRVEARWLGARLEPLKRKLENDDITDDELRELQRLQALAQSVHETATRPPHQ